MYRGAIFLVVLFFTKESIGDRISDIARTLRSKRDKENPDGSCEIKLDNVCDKEAKDLWELAEVGECAKKTCTFQPSIGLTEHPHSPRFGRSQQAITSASKRIFYSFKGIKGEVCTIKDQPCSCRDEKRCSCKSAQKMCKQQYRVERTFFVVYNTEHQSQVASSRGQQYPPGAPQHSSYGQTQYPQVDQRYSQGYPVDQQYPPQNQFGNQYGAPGAVPQYPYSPQYAQPQGPQIAPFQLQYPTFSAFQQVSGEEQPLSDSKVQARSLKKKPEDADKEKRFGMSGFLGGGLPATSQGDSNVMLQMMAAAQMGGSMPPYHGMPQQPFFPSTGSGMPQSEMQNLQMIVQSLQQQPAGFPQGGSYPLQPSFTGYQPGSYPMMPPQLPLQPYYPSGPYAPPPNTGDFQSLSLPIPPAPPAPGQEDNLQQQQDGVGGINSQHPPAYSPHTPQYPQQPYYPQPHAAPPYQPYASVQGNNMLTSTMFNYFLRQDKGSSTSNSFMKILSLLMSSEEFAKILSFEALFVMVPDSCKCEKQQPAPTAQHSPFNFFTQSPYNQFNPFASQFPNQFPFGNPFQMSFSGMGGYNPYNAFPSMGGDRSGNDQRERKSRKDRDKEEDDSDE